MDEIKTEVKTIEYGVEIRSLQDRCTDGFDAMIDMNNKHTLKIHQLETEITKNQDIAQIHLKETDQSFKDLTNRIEYFEEIENRKVERKQEALIMLKAFIEALVILFAIYGFAVLISDLLN